MPRWSGLTRSCDRCGGTGASSGSPDVVLETKHGAMAFAVGDRVQFTDTAKRLGIHNGNAGTITSIDAATGQVTARLDAPAGKEGREVTWSADEVAAALTVPPPAPGRSRATWPGPAGGAARGKEVTAR